MITGATIKAKRIQARIAGRSWRMSGVGDVLASVRISEVYQALSGVAPRRTGSDIYRALAVWRGGDSLNVSMDDTKNVFHDFVDDSGGGVLDLVVRVRGGSRQDALKWLADFAGVPLQDQPLSAEERRRWAEERQQVEQYLPDAQYWRRAAVNLVEETLDRLKAALFDPTLPRPEVNEVYNVERVLSRLRRIEGLELVTEYREWAEEQPHSTAYMVTWAKKQERVERAALLEFLGVPEPAA
jgi:hypothetical protein